MKKEIWKQINGYEQYEVSNLGRVRKISYLSTNGSMGGYPSVQLFTGSNFGSRKGKKASKPKKAFIHRLVATAFIENPDKKPFVNHKDGNKRNFAIENLEWCSSSENVRHAYANGMNGVNVSRQNKTVVEVGADKTIKRIWKGVHELEQSGFTWNKVYYSIKRHLFYRGSKWFVMDIKHDYVKGTFFKGPRTSRKYFTEKEVVEYAISKLPKWIETFSMVGERRMIPVIQVDLNGEVVNTYKSIREASSLFICDEHELSKAIKSGSKFKGFYWHKSTNYTPATEAEYLEFIKK